VDAKGRLPLPASLKKQLAAVMGEGFVLKRSVFRNCLELHPMNEWNQVMSEINQLNRFVKKNNDFIRQFTAGVKVVEVDGNGRIQIAKDLVAFAGIKKEIVLSSSVNVVEIWDKESYEKAVNVNETDFAQLAEEVMGGTKPGENGLS
jgi:MraZ protein